LKGGYEANTYVFNRGDGRDLVSDAYGKDQIVFGAGIVQGDLAYSRSGYDLVIKITDPSSSTVTDNITVQSWYSSTSYQIEQLIFADGTSLNSSQIEFSSNETANFEAINADLIGISTWSM